MNVRGALMAKYSGKEFRSIGGKKYKFMRATRLKKDAKNIAWSYRMRGKMARVIPFEGGYGIFVA